jgi:hypothetical protein
MDLEIRKTEHVDMPEEEKISAHVDFSTAPVEYESKEFQVIEKKKKKKTQIIEHVTLGRNNTSGNCLF